MPKNKNPLYIMSIHDMGENTVIRKVQANDKGRSITVVLPRNFVEVLKLGKGDYVWISLDQHKLIFQKADL